MTELGGEVLDSGLSSKMLGSPATVSPTIARRLRRRVHQDRSGPVSVTTPGEKWESPINGFQPNESGGANAAPQLTHLGAQLAALTEALDDLRRARPFDLTPRRQTKDWNALSERADQLLTEILAARAQGTPE